ncbi:TetR/AcrR family transcriptional regulator [Pseudofrankia asymbiotica]|uniref:TetR/AcrR family transcriptional regulator n=1 Tax=Pseudofrankia asymbiotica TaxID=1834516 RepID=UPI0010558D97|nr:TetR/AcrR family transcriptional regulator [Pseudofrankia asymbiotica]
MSAGPSKPATVAGAANSATSTSGDPKNGAGVPRTRGGHIATGTSAERRAKSATSATEKGERTRRHIIDCARAVFEEKGYLEVRVSDIVKRAGVAQGSFYTYFPSKLEVFQAIIREVGDEIDKTASRGPEHRHGDWTHNLLVANLRYLEVYTRNAKIYMLLEQTSTLDPEIKKIRYAGRRRHVTRVEHYIRHLQDEGIASRNINVPLTADALMNMLVGVAFWLNADTDNPDHYDSAATVTEIWVKALTR